MAGQSATLSGTGGGTGNPVVFSVDPSSGTGVCSVTGTDGTTLDYQEPGTCVVDANQAGNAGYSAAPTVTAAIAVEQVPAFSVESPPPTAVVGQDYMYTFGASGVPTPAYSLAPGAPSWLTIDPTSGVLAGTPPTGTTAFAYSVIATNSVGEATAGPFAVSVSTTTNSGARGRLCSPVVPRHGAGASRGELHAHGRQSRPGHGEVRDGRHHPPVPALAGLPHSRRPSVRQRPDLVPAFAATWSVSRLHGQLPGVEGGPGPGGGIRHVPDSGPRPRQQRGRRHRLRDRGDGAVPETGLPRSVLTPPRYTNARATASARAT